MLKKQILVIFVFLLFLNYNYAYTIDRQITDISFYEFDTYKIKDVLILSDLNQEELIFEIIPNYDLIVKINNQRYTDISYNKDQLTINLSEDLKQKPEITLEIIYLTDYYTSKSNGLWTLSYNSRYKDIIDELKITLPKSAKVNEISLISSAEVINGQIVISLFDIKNISINYELSSKTLKKNYLIILGILVIVVFGIHFILKKKPKKKTKTKVAEKDDLLLGLNENEQKIIIVIMENEGQTQKTITAKSFLPKGTVSRNIKKLVDKGYIEIKKYGVSNKLFLGEVFRKSK